MTSLKLAVVLLAFTCAFSSHLFPRYDRCNPKWVLLIHRGELYDCASPKTPNPIIKDASTFIQISNIAYNLGIKLKNQDPNPTQIIEVIQEGQAQGRWDTPDDIFKAIGLQVTAVKKNLDVLKKNFSRGANLLVTVAETKEAVAVTDIDDQEFWGVDSRGGSVLVGFNAIDSEVLIFNKLTGLNFLE